MEKSSRNKKIAIIGHAAIGSSVARSVIENQSDEVTLINLKDDLEHIRLEYPRKEDVDFEMIRDGRYMKDDPSMRRSKHQCTRLRKPKKKNKKTHRKKKR